MFGDLVALGAPRVSEMVYLLKEAPLSSSGIKKFILKHNYIFLKAPLNNYCVWRRLGMPGSEEGSPGATRGGDLRNTVRNLQAKDV